MSLISIIMPVHNEQGNLSETINSILKQTYENFEFIIIDDGSKDNTFNELEELARLDQRIKIHKQVNLGIARTLNNGLSLAKGKYIARMDAGDVAFPQWLESQYNLINSVNADLVFGTVFLVDEKEKKPFSVTPLFRAKKCINDAVIKGKKHPHSFLLGLTSSFKDSGGYPLIDGIEDTALWINMATGGKKLFINRHALGKVTRSAEHLDKQYKRALLDNNKLSHQEKNKLLSDVISAKYLYPDSIQLSSFLSQKFNLFRESNIVIYYKCVVKGMAVRVINRCFINFHLLFNNA